MSDEFTIYHSAPVNTTRQVTMDAATSALWNEWVTTMIRAEMAAREKVIVDAMILWVRGFVEKKMNGFEVELGQLRADQTIERAHRVIDLPDFRKKRSA
jgi:hypothetical protein